jgi:hypothetical protein
MEAQDIFTMMPNQSTMHINNEQQYTPGYTYHKAHYETRGHEVS